MKFKGAKIHRYLRKIFNPFTDTVLLIVATIIAYISLLFFLKYLWYLFTSTPVGEAYAEYFSYDYQITNDVLSANLINLATMLTIVSFMISFLIGSVCKFFFIVRYFYSNRSLLLRIVFFGLPLAYISAACMRYLFDFGHMSTAFTIAVVPTLCVFAGAFRIAEEYVPELVDVIFFFRGRRRKISNILEEKEIRCSADELIQKKDTKQSGADWQITLKDIWESFAAYIIITLIIIVVAGTLLIIPKIQNFNKSEVPAKAEAPGDKPPVAQLGAPGLSDAVPGSAKEWYDKALALNCNDCQKAVEYLNEAIHLNPDYVSAYRKRASIYVEMKQYGLAIDDYYEVIRLEPKDASAYHMRGYAYFYQGNLTLGCDDARKACRSGNCKLLKIIKYCHPTGGAFDKAFDN